MTVEDVTEAQWDEKVLSQNHVAVDFWAEWCGFCKQLAPIFEEISNEIQNIAFVKINVGEEMELAQKYGVFSIPTLAIFSEGKVKSQAAGAASKDKIRSYIDSNVN